MIGTNDLLDEVNRLLVTKQPDRTVYVNRCPVKFDRPSYWLEAVKTEVTDAARDLVRVRAYFMVTCFVTMDEYGNCDDLELTRAQNEVIDLFREGYVRIGNRAVKVAASTGGYDVDRSYVDLTFEFFDDRSDAVEDTPLMDELDFDLTKEG